MSAGWVLGHVLARSSVPFIQGALFGPASLEFIDLAARSNILLLASAAAFPAAAAERALVERDLAARGELIEAAERDIRASTQKSGTGAANHHEVLARAGLLAAPERAPGGWCEHLRRATALWGPADSPELSETGVGEGTQAQCLAGDLLLQRRV